MSFRFRDWFAVFLSVFIAIAPVRVFAGSMTLLGAGNVAGALGNVTLTKQFTGLGSNSGSVFSFGTLTLGAAASANRRVVIFCAQAELHSGAGNTISSAVFTPNSGPTVNADTTIVIGADSLYGYILFSAILPLGTTSTFSVTISGTTFSAPRFTTYTVDNSTLSSPTSPVTAFNKDTTGTNTTLTTTVNTLAGGGLLGLFGGASSGATFSGAISTLDGGFGNFKWGSTSNTSAATPASVVATWVGANNPASLALAAYR